MHVHLHCMHKPYMYVQSCIYSRDAIENPNRIRQHKLHHAVSAVAAANGMWKYTYMYNAHE